MRWIETNLILSRYRRTRVIPCSNSTLKLVSQILRGTVAWCPARVLIFHSISEVTSQELCTRHISSEHLRPGKLL